MPHGKADYTDRLAGVFCLGNQQLRRFGLRHLVLCTKQKKYGTSDVRHGVFPIRIAVAGLESAVKNIDFAVAGEYAPAQRHTGPINPGARPQGRWRGAQCAAREHVDHAQSFHRLVQRRIEQRLRDFHGVSRADHDEVRDTFFELRGGLKRYQRAPAVADQCRPLHAGGIQQGGNKVCSLLDACGCFARTAAMAWQVYGEHVPAMIG